MNEIKLKSCPFCGSKAEIFLTDYYRKDSGYGWKFGVHCSKCGVALRTKDFNLLIHLANNGDIVFDLDERDVAAASWNRRADNG